MTQTQVPLEQPTAKTLPENPVSPIVVVGGLVIVCMVGWLLLRQSSQTSSISDEPEAPSLAAEHDAMCGVANDSADGRAAELEQAAQAKAERYPFDAADGITAAQLYAQAVSCYRAGDQTSDADRVERMRVAWLASLQRNYAEHRMRLSIALDRHRDRDAQRELKALQHLLRDQHGPYLAWLAQMERQLEPMR